MDTVSLYGLRGKDSPLYYISPWEFVQWWAPVHTRAPDRFYKYTVWVEDADRERAEPGLDYVVRFKKFEHKDIYTFPPRNDAGPLHERFRNTWFLRRRLKPVVPCPENTPMPNSKMKSEERSKILSLYLRAWTLVEKDATVEVPFIEDLTLTASQWQSRPQRTRKPPKVKDSMHIADDVNPEAKLYTFRQAWKDFLNRVDSLYCL